MPKPKPTEIIRHEIVLGRSERDLLEGYLLGSEINKTLGTVVGALSDTTFVAVLGTLLGGWLGYNFLADEYDLPGMLGQIRDMLESRFSAPDAFQEDIAPFWEVSGMEPPSGTGTLAAQMALAGYAPTTVNFIRYFLFGLPGVYAGPTWANIWGNYGGGGGF